MKTVILAILFASVLVLAAYAIDVLLIAFAGILLAILLRTGAAWIEAHTPMSHGAALAIVIAVLLVILIGNGYLFGIKLAGQIDQLKSSIGAAWQQVAAYIGQYEWGRGLIGQQGQSAVLSRAQDAVTVTLHFVTGLIVMMFIALYTAANPDLYTRLFTSLFSKGNQPRVTSTLKELAGTLRWWLLGQMASMVVVGVVTTTGLWLLGVPLPFTLGFLTAVLNFIPNVGAILSAVLAALLALTVSPQLAGYVLILYLLIQSLEGYALTPLIQQRAVELPPGLTITVQALMSVWVGGVGLALAAPLTVVGIVLARKLYVSQPETRAA